MMKELLALVQRSKAKGGEMMASSKCTMFFTSNPTTVIGNDGLR
jgi:hypothetical protein